MRPWYLATCCSPSQTPISRRIRARRREPAPAAHQLAFVHHRRPDGAVRALAQQRSSPSRPTPRRPPPARPPSTTTPPAAAPSLRSSPAPGHRRRAERQPRAPSHRAMFFASSPSAVRNWPPTIKSPAYSPIECTDADPLVIPPPKARYAAPSHAATRCRGLAVGRFELPARDQLAVVHAQGPHVPVHARGHRQPRRSVPPGHEEAAQHLELTAHDQLAVIDRHRGDRVSQRLARRPRATPRRPIAPSDTPSGRPPR